LDDLHWADEATLSWLEYLSCRIKGAPILVLGTYRHEEAAAIAKLRTQLARLGLLQEVRLEGLSQADVLRLIRHLSGQPNGAARFSQRLHRETGGNPFFLLETLRAMFETGILYQGENGWSTGVDKTTEDYHELPLPDTVCQAIRERLSRLSLQACQVLEAGAVVGQQFDLDLVRQTSGRREDEVVDALDMLLAHQVIAEHDGTYRFNHDLIRTIVYRDLSYGRRRLLHHRVGEALVQRHSTDVAALAWHFERAEELRRAAEYALQASQHARAVFAYTAARTQSDKALALLQREAADLRHSKELAANQRLQIQALHERGWVLRLLGEMEAYARDSQEIARLAALLDDRRTAAQARWREAHAYRWFCRYAEALAAAEDGVQLSQAASDSLSEAICWREVGLAARDMGDYRRARAALEQALSRFVGLGNAEYEIHVLGNLSTLHCYQGEYQEALVLARRELVRCEEAGLSFNRRLALGDMGVAAAAVGHADEAQAWLQESLVITRQVADRTQEIFCLGHLGWLHVQLKQPAEALERLGAALALAERIGSCSEQSRLHSGLAEAHHLADDPDQAAAHARRALELAQAHGQPYDQELARRVLAGLTNAGR
jgi:tetratricopeptide (TPR) repeat protein